MPHTADDKLQWEVQKLQVETRKLSRPFLRQPAFWIGLGMLTLSIGTNILQLSNAERSRQLAEIKTASLQLDSRRLETQKAVLEAVEVGIEMGGGPARVSARFALKVMEGVFHDMPKG